MLQVEPGVPARGGRLGLRVPPPHAGEVERERSNTAGWGDVAARKERGREMKTERERQRRREGDRQTDREGDGEG